ncbi:glycosyltransferase family 76 protein [Babjeviella inositovora NRRL Y-12698]|uniref:GPI mannosyltransferase 2 n=1 Tax=Babjeviella inositovora NRRL Y-12698 TaxID=984486 RepID=A0A1E3QQJ7_9ASCO|nr:glycosyltransferase family 76 protein [Babjeviella inositovora NRRL Y-12698]ODQ79774.1 glycosyltransferase family 76 protein [Babjeviella inositovora NRRL Y-12698]
MKLAHLAKITGLFLLVKVSQTLILINVPTRFDTSSQIIFGNAVVQQHKETSILLQLSQPFLQILSELLPKLVTWDTVYLSSFFANGLKYEHEFVFAPLWWRLIKSLPEIIPGTLPSVNFYDQLLIGTLVANASHYLACLVLYGLTNLVFSSNTLKARSESHNVALRAAMLYAISPAGIFLTAPYAESICALSSFVALYLREVSFDRRFLMKPTLKSAPLFQAAYILSGAFVATAFGFRSNAVLLGYLYLSDLYVFLRARSYKSALIPLLAGSQLFAAVLYLGYLPYSLLCPQRGEWCLNTVPSLFTHAQARWSNGFLSYWTLNNIPNFAFALPTAAILLAASRHFTFTYPCRNVYAHCSIAYLLLVMIFGFSNVQILTRVASFLPLPYWYIADKLALTAQKGETGGFTKLMVSYCVVWGATQTALFGAFLPPA